MEIVPEPEAAVTLPPLVTGDAIEAWTQGEIAADDPRLSLLIAGASGAIRRHCGWHIAPVVRDTLRVTVPYGGGALDVLAPTLRLRNVTAVRIDGREVDRPAFDETGAVWAGYVSHGPHVVEIDAEHGFHLSEVPDLAAIAVQVSVIAASSPKGATREQAGSVSVSWAQTGVNVSGGLTLMDRDLAIVDGYRIGGAP